MFSVSQKSAPQKEPPIIIRMIQEDRQEINRMIQHKRAEFESVIIKGIVSMFSIQDERSQLARPYSKYFDLFSVNNHNKKRLLNSAANAIKESTNAAPMGVGNAAHLAATGVNAVGSAMLDAAEIKRQQAEAEKQLYSAQMMHYVSSKNDYEAIAQQVARILSYRFQFLLFRLAAGENGYIKLANFFIASMNTYALARLREHQGGEIKALIDAAIPPSTDALSYREWPQADLANFKWSLKTGIRRTLELDEDANQILERCGPAVRTLLGGCEAYVNPMTLRVEFHQPYTIIGLLNHAPVLNHEGGVFTGLETTHRKQETLDGNMKYPMILLAQNETTADLGVNFATKAMGIRLEEAHREALCRLVPDFFEYKANYCKHKPDEAHAVMQTLSVNNANLLYAMEYREECPWTTNREAAGQQRLLDIYSAEGNAFERDEVVTTKDHHKLKAMEVASNLFDANEAKNDALKATKETVQAQIAVNSPNMTVDDQAKQRLKAAMASRYAAFAASELMACVVKFSPLEEKHLQCTIDIIDAARAALHAARSLPIEEANKRKKILSASKKILQYAEVVSKQGAFYRENFQIVLNVVQESENFKQMKDLTSKEEADQSSTIKFLRKQMKEDGESASELTDLATNIVHYEQNLADVQQEDLLNAFHAAADGVRDELDSAGSANDIPALEQVIDLCVAYTQKNYNTIMVSLGLDDYWAENANMSAPQRQEIKERALAALTQVRNCLREAKLKIAESRVPLAINFSLKNDLIVVKAAAIEAKNASILLLKNIQFHNHGALDTEINADVSAYLGRLAAATELDTLYFLASQKEAIALDAKSPSPLQQQLIDLQAQTKRLEYVLRVNNAQAAAAAYHQLEEEAHGLTDKMSCNDTVVQAKNVRRLLGQVENTVTTDFEIEDLAISRAQQAIDEVNQTMQESRKIEEKLLSLEKICLLGREEEECVSLFDSSVEQLNQLTLFFSPNQVDTEEVKPQEVSPYGDMIKKALLQLMINGTESTAQVTLSEEEIRTTILAKLNEIQQEISKGLNHDLVNNWGFWLVAVTAKWIAQTVQEREKQVPCPIDEAMKAITQVTSQESPELKNAKNAAIKSIKQACQDVYDARNGLLNNSKKTEIRAWSLVSSTLSWAGRLTVAEFKWRQERADLRRRQRQNELESMPPCPVRSPSVKAYILVLDYSNDKLMEKKKMSGDLNKLRRLLNQCQQKLYALQQNPQLRLSLGQLTHAYQRLVQLLDIKLEQVTLEKNDLETIRSSVLAQGLSIYFNEWKRKYLDPNAQTERLKSLKGKEVTLQITEQKTNSNSKKGHKLKEPHFKDPKLQEEALNITIEYLDARIKKLEGDLADLLSTKVSSPSKKSSTFASNSFFKSHIVGIEPSILGREASRSPSQGSSHSGDPFKEIPSFLFGKSKERITILPQKERLISPTSQSLTGSFNSNT